MIGSERRSKSRWPIKLDLLYYRTDLNTGGSHRGRTVNVSTSGAYFETQVSTLSRGNLLEIVFDIPPRAGVLEFGGSMAAVACVVRTDKISNLSEKGAFRSRKYGVAVEFCQSPQLCL